MKILFSILLFCLLVGCGNEYGIYRGTPVWVKLSRGKQELGILDKITSDEIILYNQGAIPTNIPKSIVSSIRQSEDVLIVNGEEFELLNKKFGKDLKNTERSGVVLKYTLKNGSVETGIMYKQIGFTTILENKNGEKVSVHMDTVESIENLDSEPQTVKINDSWSKDFI